MRNSGGVSIKEEDAYPSAAPGQCSKFLVESELLIYFFTLYVLFSCSLLCLSVVHVWSFSLDNILLIFARILYPLLLFDFLVIAVISDKKTVNPIGMSVRLSIYRKSSIHLKSLANCLYQVGFYITLKGMDKTKRTLTKLKKIEKSRIVNKTVPHNTNFD